MADKPEHKLSRREREIMDIIYARSEATAMHVLENLSDPPSYSAVRGLIRVLEEKGHLKHRREGVRNIYTPTRPRHGAGRSALHRVLHTFYGDDVQNAVVALLDISDAKLSRTQIERIRRIIEKAREEGN